MKKLSKIHVALAILAISFLFGTIAEPGDKNEDRKSRITVQGEAVVVAKPDQARIQLGVVTQSEDAQRAAGENAKRADQILRALQKEFGKTAQIRTISYTVTPNYTYPREGGEPRIVGYIATNIIEVKTGELSRVGEMIDLATDSGANNVQSLEFILQDELPIRLDALRKATGQARTKAEAIASTLGVKVVRVLQAQESGEVSIPMERVSFQKSAMQDVATTPVQPGTIEVRANVTLTVEVQ